MTGDSVETKLSAIRLWGGLTDDIVDIRTLARSCRDACDGMPLSGAPPVVQDAVKSVSAMAWAIVLLTENTDRVIGKLEGHVFGEGGASDEAQRKPDGDEPFGAETSIRVADQ